MVHVINDAGWERRWQFGRVHNNGSFHILLFAKSSRFSLRDFQSVFISKVPLREVNIYIKWEIHLRTVSEIQHHEEGTNPLGTCCTSELPWPRISKANYCSEHPVQRESLSVTYSPANLVLFIYLFSLAGYFPVGAKIVCSQNCTYGFTATNIKILANFLICSKFVDILPFQKPLTAE